MSIIGMISGFASRDESGSWMVGGRTGTVSPDHFAGYTRLSPSLADHLTDLRQREFVGFPPRSGFLMLPRGSARAALAGLALYDAVEPRQRMALHVGRALLRSGLVGLFPSVERSEINWDWWQKWLREVVEPHSGPAAHIAFRVPASPRVCALAIDADGRPLAFGKILSTAESALSYSVRERLMETPPQMFSVPATIEEGVLDGVRHQVLAPLPPGRHRRAPHDPDRVRGVVDEFRALLDGLPRPPGIPSQHVICHTEFTPRNLRVDASGRWWLFDWDRASWGPPLADELRYWSAEFTYRRRSEPERDAERVYRLLRERGSDEDIVDAVRWPGHPWRTYRLQEERVHEAVARHAGAQPADESAPPRDRHR
jgi:hypothetical protein